MAKTIPNIGFNIWSEKDEYVALHFQGGSTGRPTRPHVLAWKAGRWGNSPFYPSQSNDIPIKIQHPVAQALALRIDMLLVDCGGESAVSQRHIVLLPGWSWGTPENGPVNWEYDRTKKMLCTCSWILGQSIL